MMRYLFSKNRISLFKILAAFCAVSAVSCSGNSADTDIDTVSPNMVVRFTVQSSLSGSSAEAGGSGGYEDGAEIESYIDVDNGCRVLFFSVNNTFLGLLNRPTVAAISGAGYKQYSLYGTPPETLPADFKIMIAANWPDMSAVDNA
ncbi:MAG: hypothetical protein K2F78_00060, partial [Muribaculaceae bacterium]|nr:hypothetical protein [Muribaculaceae bacterium]